MKSPKSSHTGDPLAAILISYPGKDTRPQKTPGNLNGTYSTPKQYSMSTNNGEISKRTGLCGANPSVLEPPLLSFPRLRGANLCVFRAALLVLKHVIFIQLLPFLPRTFRQSTVPPCLSCRPSSTPTQHSLCFRPPATTPCHPARKTVIV